MVYLIVPVLMLLASGFHFDSNVYAQEHTEDLRMVFIGLASTSTGKSCSAGWLSSRPFLAHYMDNSCNSTGTTGAWNAFSGLSKGRQQFDMDLSAYRGKTIELYIRYASDFGSQNNGIYLDDTAFNV